MATEADGAWLGRAFVGSYGGFGLFMINGTVIMTDGFWPTVRLAYGVYQVSNDDITAQITRMTPGFPVSGFSGSVQTDDAGEKSLVLTLTTTVGNVDAEFEFESAGSVTQEELTGVWEESEVSATSYTMTVDEDGAFFYQGTNGCAASGSLGIPRTDINLFTLTFEMEGCPNSARNGGYRGIGMRRPVFLATASTNDTNPGQFVSWTFEKPQ